MSYTNELPVRTITEEDFERFAEAIRAWHKKPPELKAPIVVVSPRVESMLRRLGVIGDDGSLDWSKLET